MSNKMSQQDNQRLRQTDRKGEAYASETRKTQVEINQVTVGKTVIQVGTVTFSVIPALIIALFMLFIVYILISYMVSWVKAVFDATQPVLASVGIFVLAGVGLAGVVFAIISMNATRTTKHVKQKYEGLSVVGIILKRKQYSILVTTIMLLISFLISLFYLRSNALAAFALTFLVFAVIRSILLEYRVRKGWYGTNEYEMREVLQFIIDNSQDIDFTDGGKPKRIISDEDLEKIKVRVRQSLPGATEAA